MFQKITVFVKAHKILSSIIVAGLVYGGYSVYSSLTSGETEVRYLLAQAQKGTVTVTVSGSGQVSVSQQLEVKAKASGDVTSVNIKSGTEVKAGALLVQLDARDAQKTVRDAQLSLKTATVALEKLKKPADKLTILQAEHALTQAKRELANLQEPPEAIDLLQAENALSQAKESKQRAEDNLKKAYEDGFNEVTDTFLDLPTIMTGLENLLYANTLDRSQDNINWYVNQVIPDEQKKALKALVYRDELQESYQTSRDRYDDGLDFYKATSRTAGTSTLESLIQETYETTQIISDTLKSTNTYIDYTQDSMEKRKSVIPALVATHQSSVDAYTNDTNTHLSALLSLTRTIQNEKEAIVNADRSIAEKTETLDKLKKGADEDTIQTAKEKIAEKEESLADLKDGPEPLDVEAQELIVEQRKNALADAREKLDDYSIRTPLDGMVAKIDVKRKDSVSANAVVATLITKQRIAEISLNEVDAAKVALGQRAILTFDAVPDLSITGEVAEIDEIGTVSQGVVSYTVKITFDTQDERVKPAMSVSANIITEAKPDVLMVPNSAVKSQGDNFYVEMPDSQEAGSATEGTTSSSAAVTLPVAPRRVPVEVGISNDDVTEIISGLNEGNIIVTSTINVQASAARTQNQQPGAFRLPIPGGVRR